MMQIKKYEIQDHVVLLNSDRQCGSRTVQGRIRLQAVRDKLVRVTYTERDGFSTCPSLMVQPLAAEAQWQVKEAGDRLLLTTGQVRLEVCRKTAAFIWRDAADNILTREPATGGKALAEIDVEHTVFDDAARVRAETTVDGVKQTVDGGKRAVVRQAYAAKLGFVFANDEAIYGLGQHEEGILNYRGHVQYLYQQNMKVAMPVLVSSKGYGVLMDTAALTVFRDDVHGASLWTEAVDELDYYFVYGPAFDTIVAGIRTLTGTPSMLPRWAYGFVQSKERYKDQQELIDVVKEYRRRELPLDCIVLDWQSWPKGQWGYKTFDAERFPEPGQMTAQLHELGARLMVSIWPNMDGDANHDREEMLDNGCMLGNRSTYNAFDLKARDLYWRQAENGLFRHGIDAWWCDCTEPFEADWRGEVKPEPEQQMHINTDVFRRFLDPAQINAYALEHARGIYEGQRGTGSPKRVVNLTRSGYPGQQRYGAIVWSGDIAASWKTLRRQIADGLNFCVTGHPRWTFDIGAFFVESKEHWFWCGEYPGGCENPGYRELYTRWFQTGAFLPMFRSHGTDTAREIWRFGEPGTPFHDALAHYSRLRYRLLPYIYSLAGWERLRHYTMLRMLAFDFANDPHAREVADQFMLGPALLVCPVLEPMYYDNAGEPITEHHRSRRVYLPDGADWYDFDTGQRYAGGQSITVAAPISRMPLFVKAGSILPLGPVVNHTGEKPGADWEIRVYPGRDGAFTIYEDEGDGYGYETGAYSLTPMTWNDCTGALTVHDRQGEEFPGQTRTRTLRVVFVNQTKGIGIQPAEAAIQTVYKGQTLKLCFKQDCERSPKKTKTGTHE